MRYAHLMIGLTALALAGCVSHVEGTTQDPSFGQALRQNINAQIADPTPNYARTEPPASDGARTALAQQRYEKGTVIEPAAQGTSSMGGGGK